ncbi:MAG: cupin domain-containing protein [Thermoanaerobaculia bacterium]|nr:cupin domain-containing protein [Thermoanaerobaculia bacterium]
MNSTAQAFVERLRLESHPEGGYFREVYRSDQEVLREGEVRSAATHIHFLLAEGDVSRWHVVASDEVWHFYEGSPLELLIYDPESRRLDIARLGSLDEDGCVRHRLVPRGHWQAARSLGEFSLVGCTVAPGFLFDDFRFVGEVPDHRSHFRDILSAYASFL